MSSQRKKQTSNSKSNRAIVAFVLLLLPVCFVVVLISQVRAMLHVPAPTPVVVQYDENYDAKQYVTEFFTDNGAKEMIPIIGCESEFKHFDEGGTVLKNREGSSATGIAQIMASVHPDPTVINRYNKRHNTNLSVANFDINSLVGNVAYAYVLYKVRGTKDWECSKLI